MARSTLLLRFPRHPAIKSRYDAMGTPCWDILAIVFYSQLEKNTIFIQLSYKCNFNISTIIQKYTSTFDVLRPEEKTLNKLNFL